MASLMEPPHISWFL